MAPPSDADRGLSARLDRSEADAARALEVAIQRCRGGALAIGVVQTAIHPNDHVILAWSIVALVAITFGVVEAALRSDRCSLARIGWLAMSADSVVVAAALANQLNDPIDPIQLLVMILVVEAAARWGRIGGVVAGVVGGAMSVAWAVGVHLTAGASLLVPATTFRFAIMALLGVFVGTVVRDARQQRRTAQAVVNASRDLVATFNLEGTIIAVNPACATLLGYTPEELIGQDRAAIVIEGDRPDGPPDIEVYRRDGDQRVERRVTHKDGRVVWLEIDVLPDIDAGVVHVIGRDVSERRQRESELRHRLDHDDLTGVWNRGAMCTYLDRMLEQGHQPGLVFIDLDHFKTINDTHGHLAGDVVLVELAERLGRAAGPDGLVARYAGDEFCVVVDNIADLSFVTMRAGHALLDTFAVYGETLRITAAVGGAESEHGDTAETLVRRADEAMYGVKAASRIGA